MGELLLIRHGETEWTRSRRHTSFTDVPLTAAGEAQARALEPLLAGHRIGEALVSPARRAVRTALLAGLTRLTEDTDLREWDYGGYEGVTTVDIHRSRPGWNLWTDGVPRSSDGRQGEGPDAVAARADRVLARVEPWLAAPDAKDVVLVAHAHFLRVLTARYLGLPASAGGLFVLGTGSLSRLGREHGRAALMAWNTTGTAVPQAVG
ncbi:histidine phosphatase family protein [Streptomyces sp. DH-12]|uniref:histidine phosphatase family protein n=1 Tax=unclassified Streptomyces TaxID=2593676 RepID=UPI000CCF9BEE|nr:histidine phosphatase family protein [Streptomyces sp. DH-12]PNV36585.1 histidine phosphatase family protein [Streptomyces sp. DH-12]